MQRTRYRDEKLEFYGRYCGEDVYPDASHTLTGCLRLGHCCHALARGSAQCCCTQVRALVYVTALSNGIMESMAHLEKAIVAALGPRQHKRHSGGRRQEGPQDVG